MRTQENQPKTKSYRRRGVSYRLRFTLTACLALATSVATAQTVPPGYIYDGQVLASLTQSCVAAGPGGTFVAIGPGFTANAQAVVFAKESGELRLVAFGFNSISDCAYDALADTLYVTDNAAEASGALTGDTVFAVASASTASGFSALGLELTPAGSIPSAASVAVGNSGDVFVSDAAGGGAGSIVRVTGAGVMSTFANGFDFTGGLAFEPGGDDLFVAESLASFDNQVTQLDAAGVAVPPSPFAGPSFGFGSYDLAFDHTGVLIATGAFGGDVVAIDASGVVSSFVADLAFATGVTVQPVTGRVEILSSTFIPTDEDRTVHRFIPVENLLAGPGSSDTECLSEFYGFDLSQVAEGRRAKRLTCVDGDPCDGDGVVNDVCTFPLGICLNVDDAEFPSCTGGGDITAVEIESKPSHRGLRSLAERATDALPLTDAQCFFTDGYEVEIRFSGSGKAKAGKARLEVDARAAGGSRDSDLLRLVCEPAL